MVKQVDIFVRELGRLRHEPVNVKNRCRYLSFDIIGLLLFGYSLHLQTDEENQFLVEQLARNNHHMIRSRMAEDVNTKRDLYSYVADAVNAKDDEGLRLGDLWYEALFFIIAGLPKCHAFLLVTAKYDAFAAFSIGPRGCAGKPTAYLELSLALAKIIWYFDFETAPGKLGDIGLGQKASSIYTISSHQPTMGHIWFLKPGIRFWGTLAMLTVGINTMYAQS
ncbi:cytochrome P450 [Hypoxylon sp. NC0597]|nr:cytochrome P450 [Hypoxylon sp. NC0597]